MNNQTAKAKVFYKALKVAVLSVGLALIIFNQVPTASGADTSGEDFYEGRPLNINVSDQKATLTAKKGFLGRTLDQIKSWGKDLTKEKLKIAGDIAWKAALKNFLNNLAYDTATYLATGDKGQMPMFQTQGWGGYLQNAADNAAGTFIEELGKNMGASKFNLCSPNFNVLLRINLGLVQSVRPKKPVCTFSQMTKNWETALKDKNFLPKFQDMFNPWSNDLGMALTLQTGMTATINEKTTIATKDREEGKGWLNVRDIISGRILTPADQVGAAAKDAQSAAKQSALAYTGSVVADSIDIFINTLAGKLIEKWLRQGLVSKMPSLTNKLDSLTNPNAQSQSEGAAGAKDRMKTIVEPNFKVRADYDILAELVTCPDPNKAGPTDCVIDEKFRQAIEKKLTVGQALEQGYLNGNGIFGFTSDGLEPKFNEGYPYRSMLILRKYRIIPVGWEAAAQKIKDLQGTSGIDGTKNLKDLVECFSGSDEYGPKASAPAWCKDLVDSDWVLKAPQNFCKKEGAGSQIISEQVTGEGSGSSLAVLRNDTYCADEQSCIKEKIDGSCQLYGYCTEERRKWDFNANGCEPRYNTCQTFSSEAGQQNSYLENTLDFAVCNIGNAGCQKYARSSSVSGSYDPAAKAVDWSQSADYIHLNKQTESCDAASEGCHELIRITPGQDETYESIKDDGSASFVAAAYNKFKPTGLIYEKIMPPYLTTVCGGANPPSVCQNFARSCSANEAGCELYTNVATEIKIPAKAVAQDYCPAACVGYNSFVQSATTFDSQRDGYFIPKTAKTCSAEAAGCDQFTNLDEVKKGGEGVEYYSYLRQCLKKTGNENNCAEFYSWEGSDESGYQLKVESLELDNDDSRYADDPEVTENDASLCDEAIYNLPPPDPAYNPDCRQFYNKAGGISYHLYSNTIACSDNCHPYRRTEMNVDDNLTTEGNCNNYTSTIINDTHWDGDSNQCVVCKSGGVWSTDNNACIYMAVPGQGLSCSAQANGCREYTGNTGNNVRQIFTDDFSGGIGGWTGATPANAGIALGPDNQSHSIEVANIAERPVGSAVSQGLDYVINFVARAKTTSSILTVELGNGLVTSTFTATPTLTTGWQIFEINLTGLNHEAGAGEVLRLTAAQAFYIDSIALIEITDRYYLLKNSWRTPAACDEDLAGNPRPLYMLGCAQYKDRADKTHNLKQFNKLCSESSVGCELMIDTENSSDPGASFYVDGQQEDILSCPTGPTASDDCVVVPADSFTYAVYDAEKLCGADEKGCERLGKPYKYENTALYGDIYLKNNPDQYKTILCGANAVGCDGFAYDQGEKYFKDPGDQVCEYRQQKSGTGQSYNWYKKKVKRCDDGSGSGYVNGKIDASGNPLAPVETNVCLADSNCLIANNIKCGKDSDCKNNDANQCLSGKCSVSGNSCNTTNDCASLTKCISGSCRYSCLADNNDYTCSTSDMKTLGLGGAGGSISQPTKDDRGTPLDTTDDINWVGLCAASDSGCTEYIDPLAKFNTNLIFNGSFQFLATSKTDGWSSSLTQSVTIEPNTVYRLATEKINGLSPIDLKIHCPNSTLYALGEDNQLSAGNPGTDVTVTATNDRNSQLFYYKAAASASCTITAGNSDGAVELKPVAIDYQLAQNLDSKTCNGIVNTGQGCVLFNERKQSGDGLAALNWDADTTAPGGQPVGGHCSLTGSTCTVDSDCPAGNTCQGKDSNIILKVAPDRVCDKWLACKSYIKDAKGDNVCFDIGLCDGVDANGNCQSFIASKKENQAVGGNLDSAKISNLSGYSKVGISGGTLKTDYYPFGAMEQKGEMANFANGGFEYYGSNLYPIGWNWGNQAGASWNANIFSVVSNPIAAQTEGIGYAREGASFLKLGSSYTAVSEQIDVIPGADYTITAYLNTKNLKKGEARIDILGNNICRLTAPRICQGPGSSGSSCTSDNDCPIASQVVKQDLGNDWNFQMGKFPTGTNSQIKIKLYSSAGGAAGSEGNFYYDDIKIRPALESKCLEADGDCKTSPYNAWYTPQSCRLYPQSDSLACDYYEDSGIRQKGWPGYCLEYDRRPGDPNTCLLWYPIDKVKGDGIEEGAGYADRLPLYYCTAGQTERVYEYRHAFFLAYQCGGSGSGCSANCPLNYIKKTAGSCGSCGFFSKKGYCYCVPNPASNLVVRDGSLSAGFDCSQNFSVTSSDDGWYLYDGIMTFTNPVQIRSSNKYAKYLCNGAASCTLNSELFRSKVNCTQVVQTVSLMGQNKYWASRVYKGSDYTVDQRIGGLNYTYGTDAAPFGSMVPPSAFNPYDWDGQADKDGIQLISYSTGEDAARSGKGYGCSGDCNLVVDDASKDNFPYAYGGVSNPTGMTGIELVKRLFAQSYGIWKWSPATQVNSNCSGGTSSGACDPFYNNDCPGGACSVKTGNVCFRSPGVSCKTCAAGQTCRLGTTTENRCGGVESGDECCVGGGSRSGVTSCSGASCSPSTLANESGLNRCDGIGAPCCPGGTACFICADNTVITGVTSASCGTSGSICRAATIYNDNYSCDGSSDLGEICCNPDPLTGEGNCVAISSLVDPSVVGKECSSGLRDGQYCEGHTCVGGQCISQVVALRSGESRYSKDTSTADWGPPGANGEGGPNFGRCNVVNGIGARGATDYCAIPPTVSNVKVNSGTTDVTLRKNGFVNLTFNTKADSNQLPLVMYGVDWGDGSNTMVTGVEMRDKQNPDQPESVYHLYSYWDLKAKHSTNQVPSGGSNTIACGAAGAAARNYNAIVSGYICPVDGACCVIKPKIQIKDNWGWCNKGQLINTCGVNQWDSFAGWVVVKEK